MDILKSSPISPFGGLNFVLEAFDKLKVGEFLDKNLPTLPKQTRYSWKDIFYSYWSVFFCGGNCAEDFYYSRSLRPKTFMKMYYF